MLYLEIDGRSVTGKQFAYSVANQVNYLKRTSEVDYFDICDKYERELISTYLLSERADEDDEIEMFLSHIKLVSGYHYVAGLRVHMFQKKG